MRLFPWNSRERCAQLLLRPQNREAQSSAERRPVWPAPSGRSPEKSGRPKARPPPAAVAVRRKPRSARNDVCHASPFGVTRYTP